jgi:hypothetical protein
MKGLSARGLWRCTARATSSLPEPDSPVIRTVALDWLSGQWRETPPAWPAPGRGFPAPSRPRSAHRFGALTLADGAPDQLERLIDVEGLRQVFEGAALKRRDGAFEIGVGGHDDDRQRREALLDLPAADPVPTGRACGCRTPAPAAARHPSSCERASLAEAKLLNGMPRGTGSFPAPSGLSDRRLRSRPVS